MPLCEGKIHAPVFGSVTFVDALGFGFVSRLLTKVRLPFFKVHSVETNRPQLPDFKFFFQLALQVPGFDDTSFFKLALGFTQSYFELNQVAFSIERQGY